MKSNFRIIRLSENFQLKPFDCGDNDLNNKISIPEGDKAI